MDFLRIGGEFNFLYLMPREARTATIKFWYRGAEKKIGKFLADYQVAFDADTGIEYTSADPKRELYERLTERVTSVLSHDYDLPVCEADAGVCEQIQHLADLRGDSVSLLPELSLLSIQTSQGMQVFTLVHNDAHTNVASMVGDSKRRVPAEDTLTVVPGYLGAYPNAFYHLTPQDLPRFVAAVGALSDEADYEALMDAFGVRRSDAAFWAHSDRIFEQVQALNYAERGVLDYSRVENR